MAIGTCKYVNSDIQQFFIAKWDSSIVPIYSANNVISRYEWINTWYEIRLNTAVITYSQEMSTQNPNGIFYDEKISVSIPKADNDKWNELVNVLTDTYIIVFQDANGEWFTFGYKYGAQVRSYVLSENQYVISFDSPHANNLPTLIEDSYVLNYIFNTPSPTPTPSPSITPTSTTTPTPTITPSISVTPSCARPDDLETFTFFETYSGVTGMTNFKTTLEGACDALTNVWGTSGYTFSGAVMQAASLTIGETAYYTFGPKCTKYTNGYYILQSGATTQIVWINAEKVAGLPSCINISPTPSTTPTPTITPSISVSRSETPSMSITPSMSRTPSITPSSTPTAWGYGIRLYTCNGSNCGVYVGTAPVETNVPLVVGKYYTVNELSADLIEVYTTAPLGGSSINILNGPYNSCNEACF